MVLIQKQRLVYNIGMIQRDIKVLYKIICYYLFSKLIITNKTKWKQQRIIYPLM